MSKIFVVSALVMLAVGCSRPGATNVPTATEQCDAPEMPALQGGTHLIGGREPPVPYSSTPPTSGWHVSGTFEIAVQPPGDPLTEVEQVSVLEAGGAVVTYNAITDADRAALEQRVSERYDGRVAVTAYDKIAPGEVTFTGWGVLQRCEGLDLAALDQFVAAYADDEPATPGDQ